MTTSDDRTDADETGTARRANKAKALAAVRAALARDPGSGADHETIDAVPREPRGE
ncbi:MAG TPA: hypothetical protein VF444_16310 [Pseudonocardiaceae bacterium]